MPAQFRLDDRDRKKFGGPEWVTFDREALDDTTSDISGPWDRELKAALGKGIRKTLVEEFAEATSDGIRAAVWLARKLSDIDTVAFAEFHIRWAKVAYRVAPAGDASPPGTGSSEPSSLTE